MDRTLDADTADKVNSVAKLLGVRVQFVDSVREGTANTQISGSDVLVEKDNPNPVMFLLGHEWTHRLQETAPVEYRKFRDLVSSEISGEASVLLEQYRKAGESITYEAALDEAAANYAGRMIEDGAVLDDFVQRHRTDRTLLEKIRDAIRTIISKLTGEEKRKAQTAEGRLSAALNASQKQAVKNDLAQKSSVKSGETDADTRYSINEKFSSDIQEWNKTGRPAGERFILGSTGPVLQGLGAIESDIYMDGDKISTILKQHPEMTIREIQHIPDVLEDPVVVLKSRNVRRAKNQYGESRIVMFGAVKAQDGRPIMCVLDLRPAENGFLLDDMQKVNSAYTKDNDPAGFVQKSQFLYADKKRTIPLLRGMGFQMPMSLLRSGSTGSISHQGNSVNMEGAPLPARWRNSGARSARAWCQRTSPLWVSGF